MGKIIFHARYEYLIFLMSTLKSVQLMINKQPPRLNEMKIMLNEM